MVHVAKYLGRSAQDPKPIRAELEEFATLVLPRWRQHTQFARFLPDLLVTSVMPGSKPRPGTDFLRLKRFAVVGDWIGPEGMLADAAVASALAAARELQQRKAVAA